MFFNHAIYLSIGSVETGRLRNNLLGMMRKQADVA
jgi:hypothetical protein